MSRGEPAVRGVYMKDFVVSLDELGPVGRRVRVQDAEIFELLGGARRTAWLPVEINVRMVEAVGRGLGRAGGSEFFATHLQRQFGTPLWRNFIEGGVALLGLDPGSLIKWLPQAYSIIFRECGVWRVLDRAGTSVTVRLDDVPPLLLEHELWIDSVRAGLCALYHLAGTSGEAKLVSLDANSGSFAVELSWKPR